MRLGTDGLGYVWNLHYGKLWAALEWLGVDRSSYPWAQELGVMVKIRSLAMQ